MLADLGVQHEQRVLRNIINQQHVRHSFMQRAPMLEHALHTNLRHLVHGVYPGRVLLNVVVLARRLL